MITSLFDLIVNPAKINYTCLCLNCGLKLRVFRMAFEVLSWQHLSFQVICEHTFRFWTPLCIFALGHWSCHIILIKYQILCWYENVTLLFASFIITSTLMLISQVELAVNINCFDYGIWCWTRNKYSWIVIAFMQGIRRWKIKQYINHICRAIIVYFIASKLEMSNCNTYIFLMFRAQLQ